MMRRCLLILSCVGALVQATPAGWTQVLDVRDQRAHNLFNDVRCPVCSGQSIAESDVPVSISIRQYVQLRIDAGDSDDVIKQNLVERYGQDILFEPTLGPSTLILWLAPWGVLALLVGGIWVWSGRSGSESH